jgi:hypothetical protein
MAGAGAWVGWRLHAAHPMWWPLLVLLIVVVASVIGVVWAPRRWLWLRRTPLLERPTERLCRLAWAEETTPSLGTGGPEAHHRDQDLLPARTGRQAHCSIRSRHAAERPNYPFT